MDSLTSAPDLQRCWVNVDMFADFPAHRLCSLSQIKRKKIYNIPQLEVLSQKFKRLQRIFSEVIPCVRFRYSCGGSSPDQFSLTGLRTLLNIVFDSKIDVEFVCESIERLLSNVSCNAY